MPPIDVREINAAFVPHVRPVPDSVAKSRKSPEVATTKKTPRHCLQCGKKFISRGIGNRICPLCGGYGKRSFTPAGAD